MVLAISFLEAPLKLRAPGVTVRIGLGIGRLVFRALNTVEAALAAGIVVTMGSDHTSGPVTIALIVPVVALLAQLAVLRPGLTRRSNLVLADYDAPHSHADYAYIVIEAFKSPRWSSLEHCCSASDATCRLTGFASASSASSVGASSLGGTKTRDSTKPPCRREHEGLAVSEGGLEPDGFTLRMVDLGVLSVKCGSVTSRWSLLHPAMCPPGGAPIFTYLQSPYGTSGPWAPQSTGVRPR
jgi:hypothetical protein